MLWEWNLKFCSSFCFGSVFHKRFVPKQHSFRYRMFMPLLDLDEMDRLSQFSPWLRVGRFGLYSFYPDDYLKHEVRSGESLKQRVLRIVERELSVKLSSDTRVLMLSQWRFLGRVFNPITVFYIGNETLDYLCAEVSNTPWKERHVYSYKLQRDGQKESWTDHKAFHVSPYNPMEMTYHWQSGCTSDAVSLTLNLKSHDELQFVASFDYERRSLTRKNFLKGIFCQPFFSFHTVLGIYWQALKLFVKRIPLYNHPKYSDME